MMMMMMMLLLHGPPRPMSLPLYQDLWLLGLRPEAASERVETSEDEGDAPFYFAPRDSWSGESQRESRANN